MMNKTKTILLWGMIAGVAGCAYDVDRSMYDYPVIVSPEYALKPNTRWTSLYYYGAKDWQPEVSIQIFRDSHSVIFHRWDVKEGRSPTLYDGRVTAEKWNWIVSQLEQARVSRWKTFYLPESFEDFPSGSVWGLDFQDGSNTVGTVLGYAVWPNGWDAFQAILDSFDVVEK